MLVAERISAAGSGDRSRLSLLIMFVIEDEAESGCSEGWAFAGNGNADTGEGAVPDESCFAGERLTPLLGSGVFGASFCFSVLMLR